MVSNCILYDTGAQSISAVINAFFQQCVKKAQTFDKELETYHPLIADIRHYGVLLDINRPLLKSGATNLNDFSEEKLLAIENFLIEAGQRIPGGGITFDDQRVYCEIEQKGRESIQLYEEALALIDRWPPWLRSVWKTTIKLIVPLCRAKDGNETGMCFTSKNVLGAIFTSPDRRYRFPALFLNISFAHELAHQVLYVYQFAGEMVIEKDRWIYSGVRRVERPAPSALHAAMALAYMLEAIKSLLKTIECAGQRNFLEKLQDEYKDGLALGLDALRTVQLSPLGNVIVKNLSEVLL